MSFELWITAFVLLAFIAYTPGPMTMFSMSTSLRNGFGKTLPAIAGGSSAYLTQMLIVYLGLGVVVQSSCLVFNAIKWVGVAYLLVLAVRNWNADVTIADEVGSVPPPPLARRFFMGYATGMSNPKSILVFTVLFPQFIEPEHYTLHFAILASSFCVVQACSAMSYALFGAKAFRWLQRRCLTHLQSRVTAMILACAAGFLATSEK
ncbi:homoserine/homoserine lactone efflux protein [Paucidesulfovibrio gracilis DSM 16080]|uniref:Homoserine/homoserine lactone efflux protein n=1 Tax=Paucidesulfovibrio gracilis DSM 16080 TaxID=1121449 RepID=A0A1T4WHS2_9BACT|nr:LysE family translocator [Paucidesulfovibrio gracilis]SKA76886.1 homoserine/homoserine lactone efflux protein [Paucidesulfovibrio gracilis DSM 16080]